jgi:hypothetical protein
MDSPPQSPFPPQPPHPDSGYAPSGSDSHPVIDLIPGLEHSPPAHMNGSVSEESPESLESLESLAPEESLESLESLAPEESLESEHSSSRDTLESEECSTPRSSSCMISERDLLPLTFLEGTPIFESLCGLKPLEGTSFSYSKQHTKGKHAVFFKFLRETIRVLLHDGVTPDHIMLADLCAGAGACFEGGKCFGGSPLMMLDCAITFGIPRTNVVFAEKHEPTFRVLESIVGGYKRHHMIDDCPENGPILFRGDYHTTAKSKIEEFCAEDEQNHVIAFFDQFGFTNFTPAKHDFSLFEQTRLHGLLYFGFQHLISSHLEKHFEMETLPEKWDEMMPFYASGMGNATRMFKYLIDEVTKRTELSSPPGFIMTENMQLDSSGGKRTKGKSIAGILFFSHNPHVHAAAERSVGDFMDPDLSPMWDAFRISTIDDSTPEKDRRSKKSPFTPLHSHPGEKKETKERTHKQNELDPVSHRLFVDGEGEALHE